MIAGIGTDILHMGRLKNIIHNLEDSFFTTIFTEQEMTEGKKQSNQLYYFSGRFAAKEAIFKTFKVHGDAIHLNEIEILKTDIGYPVVNLYGRAKDIADSQQIIDMDLSLSYDTDYVIAFATALKQPK